MINFNLKNQLHIDTRYERCQSSAKRNLNDDILRQIAAQTLRLYSGLMYAILSWPDTVHANWLTGDRMSTLQPIRGQCRDILTNERLLSCPAQVSVSPRSLDTHNILHGDTGDHVTLHSGRILNCRRNIHNVLLLLYFKIFRNIKWDIIKSVDIKF